MQSDRNKHALSDKVSMDDLTSMTKKMLEDSGVKTRLTDNCSIWHQVYKDLVFNETMFYHDRESFAVSLLKEPYIAVSMYNDAASQTSYAQFFLDTITVYPKDTEQFEKTIRQLSEQYKKCYEIYSIVKDDIDRANKSIEETSKKVEFKQLVRYVNQTERQLNSQLQELLKISEIVCSID